MINNNAQLKKIIRDCLYYRSWEKARYKDDLFVLNLKKNLFNSLITYRLNKKADLIECYGDIVTILMHLNRKDNNLFRMVYEVDSYINNLRNVDHNVIDELKTVKRQLEKMALQG